MIFFYKRASQTKIRLLFAQQLDYYLVYWSYTTISLFAL